MSFGKALYFPYINFQDNNWVKYTLLYWDGIKRIVPLSYDPRDDDEVKSLIDAGLVENIDPRSGTTPYAVGAAKEFIPTMNKLLDNRLNPARGSAISRAISSKDPESMVHVEKMDDQVIRLLMESNLATRVGDWFSMDTGLAGYYMLCLAAHISEKQQAPLLSDSFQMETAGSFFQYGRITEDTVQPVQEDIGFHLARLVIPVPRPANLSAVSMKELIEFHRKHEPERMRFRQAIEKTTEDAGKVDDPAAMKDFLEEKKKVIEDAAKDQKQSLSELHVDTLYSLCSLTAPAGVGVVAGAISANPVVAVAASVGGIALSLVNWLFGARRRHREAVKDSEWHYLLTVQKEFNVSEIANRAQTAFREFVYD
jgi:hypothetical protein